MSERARLIGATLQIDSTPGSETMVSIHLPLDGGPNNDQYFYSRWPRDRKDRAQADRGDHDGYSGGRQAAHVADVVYRLRACHVDLLTLDMTMPGISGVDLIRRVRAEQPALPILVLSIRNEAQVVTRALRAGATGYVTKDSDLDVLLAAIRKLAAGGRFIDLKLVDAIVFDAPSNDGPPHEILSDREFQVLRMLAAGSSINKIADALSLSAKTISTHKMRLMQKLGFNNNC